MSEPLRESLHDLAAAYALGALDPDEVRAFEAALAKSPPLQRKVAEFREVAALLALGAPAKAFDPALKQRLAWRLGRAKVAPTGGGARPWLQNLAWAAAIAGIVVSSVLADRARRLEREVDTAVAQLDQARRTLANREEALSNILASTVTFTLGTPGERQPSVRIYWNRQSNMWVLLATSLAPAPAGRAYQLWFLQDGRAVPSVTFNSEAGGTALVMAPGPATAAGLSGAAISEEPAGGSAQPTTTPILVGSLTAQ